jgi:hypothetical protein
MEYESSALTAKAFCNQLTPHGFNFVIAQISDQPLETFSNYFRRKINEIKRHFQRAFLDKLFSVTK